MNEMAALIIEDYIEDSLFEPAATWPKYWFENRAYSRWAAEEILNLVRTTDKNPYIIIEDFINKMSDFMEYNYGSEESKVFKIAKEAAQGILCLFM